MVAGEKMTYLFSSAPDGPRGEPATPAVARQGRSSTGRGTAITPQLEVWDPTIRELLLAQQSSKKRAATFSLCFRLTFLHSVFTRKAGAGTCRLQIRSWLSNGEVLSTDARAVFKLFDCYGNEVSEQGQVQADDRAEGEQSAANAKEQKELVIGRAREFATVDALASVEVSVTVTEARVKALGQLLGQKLLRHANQLGKFKFYIAEVFKKQPRLVLEEKYFMKEFVDKRCSQILKVSAAMSFEPASLDDAERI